MKDQTHSNSIFLLLVFLAFFLIAGCSENKDNNSLLKLQLLSGSNSNGSSQTKAKWGNAVWGVDKWNP